MVELLNSKFVQDNNGNFRSALAMLYPDSTSYDCETVIETIKQLQGANYWLILHDKDTDSNGEYKKPHYHCLVAFTNKRSARKFIACFPDSVKWFACDSVKASIVYFAHADGKSSANGKYRYSASDYISNKSVDDINEVLSINDPKTALDDELAAQKIFNYITSNGPSLEACLSFVFANGLWASWRRGSNTFIRLLNNQ